MCIVPCLLLRQYSSITPVDDDAWHLKFLHKELKSRELKGRVTQALRAALVHAALALLLSHQPVSHSLQAKGPNLTGLPDLKIIINPRGHTACSLAAIRPCFKMLCQQTRPVTAVTCQVGPSQRVMQRQCSIHQERPCQQCRIMQLPSTCPGAAQPKQSFSSCSLPMKRWASPTAEGWAFLSKRVSGNFKGIMNGLISAVYNT